MKKLIAVDKTTKNQLSQDGSKKISQATKAKEMLKKVGIEITDYKAFHTSFTGYADRALKERSEAFKYADMAYLYELNGLSRNELLKCEIAYKRLKVELNDDLTQIIYPELNIYAESKAELARLEIVDKLRDVITELSEYGVKVSPMDVQRIFKVFNQANPNQYEPNIYFIKHGKV